jgi:general secretion pathway protein E
VVPVSTARLQDADLRRAQLIATRRHAALNPLLVRLGLVSEKDLAAVMAEFYGLPILQDSDLPDAPVELPGGLRLTTGT